MDLGMQGLHPAIHDLREPGMVGDVGDLEARLPQRLGGAAGGQQLDAALGQGSRQLDQSALVGNRQQSAADRAKRGWHAGQLRRLRDEARQLSLGAFLLQGPFDLGGVVVDRALHHQLLGAPDHARLAEIDAVRQRQVAALHPQAPAAALRTASATPPGCSGSSRPAPPGCRWKRSVKLLPPRPFSVSSPISSSPSAVRNRRRRWVRPNGSS